MTTYSQSISKKSNASKEQGQAQAPYTTSNADKIIASLKMSEAAQKGIVKDAEKEFRRRQGFKRLFPSVDYHYYK
jgi:hypothetical protein